MFHVDSCFQLDGRPFHTAHALSCMDSELQRKLKQLSQLEPGLGYRAYHAKLKEHPDFSGIGLKKADRCKPRVICSVKLARQVMLILAIQGAFRSQRLELDMMPNAFWAHWFSGIEILGAGSSSSAADKRLATWEAGQGPSVKMVSPISPSCNLSPMP